MVWSLAWHELDLSFTGTDSYVLSLSGARLFEYDVFGREALISHTHL